jgi:hypothetical protein
MATTVHQLPDLPTIPQFPGDDPAAEICASALDRLGWFTPAQSRTLGAMDPDFAPVARLASRR